ncbi:MAG: universal stress protein [Ardenticatenia bacterium]|nr:universal stress protein [Ardenticatenia bacterium]
MTNLARAYGAELVLFRAVTMPFSGVGVDAGMVIEAHYWDLAQEEAETYLQGVAGSLHQQGFTVRYEVGQEPVADAILACVERVQADLVAMTTHAREGLTRLIMGSVADRVVRAGQVPVLVVRPETEIE